MKNTKSYHPGHPNPRFYRPDWHCLNGRWDFIFDDQDVGVDQQYFKLFPTHTLSINVPYAYETIKSGVDDKTEHNVLWYRRTFEQLQSDKQVLLHIERSDYQTMIWLNGQLVGEHIGGYDSFSFDITDTLTTGTNELVIRVFDSKDDRQPRGKQTWKEKPFECFYHGTSGIYGDVWLEIVDRSYLSNIDLRASLESEKLYVNAVFSNNAIGKTATISASFDDDIHFSKTIEISGKEMAFDMDIPKPLHLWSVDKPCLYDVEIEVKTKESVCDRVLTYFGINNVDVLRGKILLNKHPVFLKLVLDQGYYPGGDLTGSIDDYLFDIDYLKNAGFNGVRKHEKVEGNLFYYLADRDGLLNWLEFPSPHRFDNSMLDILTKQWCRIVAQHISHPSLMAYVCYNESWGIQQVKSDRLQQEMATHLYQETKKIDPYRLVISNDGWEHTISDLLTVHNYQESKNDLLDTYKDMRKQLTTKGNAKANTTRMCYADGFSYRGEPIVFSEFAGIAIDTSTDAGWGYGRPANGVAGFMEKLKGQIEAIKETKRFVGYCITQLTDVYQETNGLMTQDRKIKIDPNELKKIV